MKASEPTSQYPEPEEWRTIPGYPENYEVSNWGRLRRWKNGKLKYLKLTVGGGGYLETGLYINGKFKHVRAHTLVALSFIGPRPDGYHIHHTDEDKQNNFYRNLSYLNPRKHMSSHDEHVLSLSEISEIRNLYLNHVNSVSELAHLTNVGQLTIRKIIADLLETYPPEKNPRQAACFYSPPPPHP